MRPDRKQVFRAWLDRRFIALWLPTPLLAVMGVVFWHYRGWVFTGFSGKTSWDWLDLLIVPLVLVVGAYLFNRSERKSDRETAANRIQEDLLSTYLDRMSELLTRGQLRDGLLGADARHIARARTLTVLRNLNPSRRSTIIRFLSDSSLTDGKILDLTGASLDHTNLTGADLTGANLREANLSWARLTMANLTGANLRGANLSWADLSWADLIQANLLGAKLSWADLLGAKLAGATLILADLRGADLRGAKLTGAFLSRADLRGAFLIEANLRGADLDNVQNLTIEQLCSARSLYQVRRLAPDLMDQVKEQCPQLLEEPKDE